MNLKFKKGDIELEINGFDNTARVKEIIEYLEPLNPHFITKIDDIVDVDNVDKDVDKPKEIVKPKERPMFRNRVPNTVDLSEVEITKAITTEPMIMCPECGQSLFAIVHISKDENYFIRKIYKNKKPTYELVLKLNDGEEVQNIVFNPAKAKRIDYYNDIMKVKVNKDLKGKDINVSKETVMICPMCKEGHAFVDWNETYNDPTFESDHPCELCGGETVEIINKDKTKVRKCEICGHDTPV